jgi:hypothetical protein
MPVGKGLQFFCISKKRKKKKIPGISFKQDVRTAGNEKKNNIVRISFFLHIITAFF